MTDAELLGLKLFALYLPPGADPVLIPFSGGHELHVSIPALPNALAYVDLDDPVTDILRYAPHSTVVITSDILVMFFAPVDSKRWRELDERARRR